MFAYIRELLAFRCFVCAILALSSAVSSAVVSASPHLAFSDLVSGPDVGLGDGKGSGVIVTVWGQGLGNQQGGSKVIFTDSSGTAREAASIYYWKNADGRLPSGPSNLFASHQMQEIAFSIPDSALGEGSISVLVDGQTSNSLPFSVRDGKIFHVKSTGTESSSGSWSDPFGSVGAADMLAPAGSTIYVHDVDTGDFSQPQERAIYWNNPPASSSLEAQFSIIAYPGNQPKAIAQRAVEVYLTEGLVVSKFDLYASNYLAVDSNDQPIGEEISTIGGTTAFTTSKNGRSIANRIGDIPGGCASSQGGAIVGNAMYDDYVSNFKALGNEIYNYGCAGTSKFHHTTYLTVRSGPNNRQVEPWEWGYNYLHGNDAKFGIHNYDEGAGCGDLTGPLRIYKNVIVDQGGAGINVGSTCGWSMDVIIRDNVLINVGKAAAWNGIDPSTSDGSENGGISIRDGGLTGTVYAHNNLIYGYTSDRSPDGSGCITFQGNEDNVRVVWEKNICFTEKDLPFVGYGYQGADKLDNITGSRNVWFYAGGSSPSNAKVPKWDNNPVTQNPQISLVDDIVFISEGSALTLLPSSDAISALSPIYQGTGADVYGTFRDSNPDIGPVEVIGAKPAPTPPSGVSIQ